MGGCGGRPIRVLIVDDQAIVRGGIVALLATEPGVQVVGQAPDGEEALRLLDEQRPDVVLMDLMMPGMDGVETTRRVLERAPCTRVLILTSFAGDDDVFPALQAGAIGYLLKDTDPGELVRAVKHAYADKSVFDPEVARKLLQELKAASPPEHCARLAVDRLTPREVEVLHLIGVGLGDAAIAERLVVGESTVRTHVRRILAKLRLASRTQAALYALRRGYANLSEAELPDDGPGRAATSARTL